MAARHAVAVRGLTVATLGFVARSIFSRMKSKVSPPNGGEPDDAARVQGDGSDGNPSQEQSGDADPHGAELDETVSEGIGVPETSDDPQKGDSSEKSEDSEDSQSQSVEEATARWAESISSMLREDAEQFMAHRIRLGDVHPGGVAQLYVDHPTRLDTLIRESTALKHATSRVESLLKVVADKRELHGLLDVHLAIGTATWDALKAAAGETADVPVMMRRVDLDADDDGTLTLELLPGVEVNSRLLRALERAGVNVDPEHLGELMRGPDGFLPGRAFDYLRAVGQALPGFELREEHVLGLYSHPAGNIYRQLDNVDELKESEVFRALTGDPEARSAVGISLPEPNPFDRDPWKEIGLGDQSPQELDVVETVAQGSSVLVRTSGRDRCVKATASFAAAVAQSGRSVLVISNDSHFREALAQTFSSSRTSAIVADFGLPGADQDIAQRLLDAATSEEMVESDAAVDELRSELRRSRETLAAYTEALHEPFEPWNVSAFQALQVLTDLTSLPNPPSTQVRFPETVLSMISNDGGAQTLDLFERASAVGLLEEERDDGPWRGVSIGDVEDVGPILRSLGRLTGSLLPAIRMQMSTTAARCELRQASTLRLWKKQLELLAGVREVLDTFRPEVLESSPADMVVATASKQWRKSKNINLKGPQRRDLVRRARDLVRPGVHVEDLHGALVRVQAVRLEWAGQSDRDSWPTVPDSIRELESTWADAQSELEVLRPHLEPIYGDLDAIYVEELDSIFQQLYQDPQGALEVPEAALIVEEISRKGLTPLVEDMRARGVSADQISLELDLAWWASALGYMLGAEPRLGGFDPATLQDVLERTKTLDALQVESLGPELVRLVRARAWETLGLYPQPRKELISALGDGTNPLDLFAGSNLPWDLMPIVVAAPGEANVLVGPSRSIDCVIIAGFKELPAAALIPVISRAKQVVAVEDSRQPSDVSALLGDSLSVIEIKSPPTLTGQLAARILESLRTNKSHVVIPTPASASPVTFVHADGRGTPAPGVHAIESSKAEVDLVVSMVSDHLQESDDPLFVLTLTERHAEQIRAALGRISAGDAQLREALEAVGGAENIVGLPGTFEGTNAAKVILSVGFAKTPHGRVIHSFGPLSTEEGATLMEALALAVGDNVTVVTSLSAGDIDDSRLRYAGERALHDLLRLEEALDPSVGQVPGVQEDHEPEQLLQDLAERLHGLGLDVVPNLGSAEGLKIPLAIGHPEAPGQLLVAVMTDNDEYMAERSQRVRNSHWARTLESLGWKVRTVLSMSVFIDPNREARRIVELTLDAVDDYYARVGLPHTPAAAAALGVPTDAVEEPSDTSTGEAPDPSPSESGRQRAQGPVADGERPEAPIDGEPVDTDGREGDESEGSSQTESLRTAGDGEVAVVDVDNADIVIQEHTGARGARPSFARGLPLAAYSDDQLDELALWIRGDFVDRKDEEVAEELRALLGITRRGAQTDAVLLNVARRTRG